MQILRIILMVCFVFTVYPSIGEAVDIEAVDISEGSKKKSSSRAELPLGEEDVGAFESKENQEHTITLEGNEVIELEAGFDYVEAGSQSGGNTSEPEPHLNERILQLQKEGITTPMKGLKFNRKKKEGS